MDVSAVLFDYDDTLAKTEAVALASACDLTNEVLRAAGIPHQYNRAEFIARYPGRTYREIMREIDERFHLNLSAEQLTALTGEEKARAIATLRADLKATPGTMDALRTLTESNKTVAIVSSSAEDRLQACLECTGQLEYFSPERIFSVQGAVPGLKGKPAPDIYLHALKVLGMTPFQAVAVEDSVSGVRSAVDAGLRVIGFVGALAYDRWSERARDLFSCGALCVIDHMAALPWICAQLDAGKHDSALKLWGPELWTDTPVRERRAV